MITDHSPEDALSALLDSAGLTPDVLARLIAWAGAGDFGQLQRQLRTVGGCSRPVHLSGAVYRVDPASGDAVPSWYSTRETTGTLLVPCGSRHGVLCAACARRYAGDTWFLIYAGLAGGKGRAASVRTHPRLFVTLTAPGFGPVHTANISPDGRPAVCRPRRDKPLCLHGLPAWCSVRHPADDPVVGAPLCDGCYDWPGLVLFNAHATALWHRWRIQLAREIARLAGRTVRDVADAVRIACTRVAEIQARGAIHLHAIIRADDATDPDLAPPDWVTADLLADAAIRAAGCVQVEAPANRVGEWVFGWGPQATADPIPSGQDDETERRLAAYLAKYVTKSLGAGLARRIGAPAEIPLLDVTRHIRALVGIAWRLGGLPEFQPLRLRAWAHQNGFRGTVASRTRTYSTTLTALHQQRRDYRAAQAAGGDRFGDVQADALTRFRYARTGLDPAGTWLITNDDRDETEGGSP
ncbi:replication initiator [Cryptosporangium sp. NPDC051539]|uniref:replication initiator n=1 Tax=Cryptosporangium sp. NPDC051539 TaxID=3363962 RepID=UPI0037884483